MDKEELIKLVQDPKYIPGIYNYCDRWCERCQFTSRCLNHSLEEEENCNLESIDETNEIFWNSIKNSLALALSLIKDLAQEKGIDLSSIEIEQDEEIDNKVDMLTHISMKYPKMIDNWFKNNHHIIESELRKQKKQSHLKIIDPNNSQIYISLQEIIEVINYYKYAITVKLSRAIKSRENEAEIELEDFPKDSDGSAKIALIEIDRSINAWSQLLKYCADKPQDILKIINYLQQIRELAEKEFPNARAFIRPGFDEISQNI
ncbi:MAG: hypothetical protein AB4372_33485 [Xenococcus sp. (in: cyanobacteria)]